MLERRNNQGYLYLLPWIIGFLIFQLYPIAMSLYYSFTDYSFGSQYDLLDWPIIFRFLQRTGK